MSECYVVRIFRNGRECYYLTYDLFVNDKILSFHIDEDFYVFEFSLLAYHMVMDSGLIDCTKLKEVKLCQTQNY